MRYFLKDYDLTDLFKIRDALAILDNYELANKELISAVALEIENWREDDL